MMPLAYASVSCGEIIDGMSSQLPYLVSLVINILKFAVLIVLVIVGMIDLLKAVMAQKEDEIKKAEQTFLKRLIAGILVFFVVVIIQFVFQVTTGEDENSGIWECFSCFVNGPTESAKINGGKCRQ